MVKQMTRVDIALYLQQRHLRRLYEQKLVGRPDGAIALASFSSAEGSHEGTQSFCLDHLKKPHRESGAKKKRRPFLNVTGSLLGDKS